MSGDSRCARQLGCCYPGECASEKRCKWDGAKWPDEKPWVVETLAEQVGGDMADEMMDLAAEAEAELHPDLAPWVEDGSWGKMLRHPLVYQVPLVLPGHANKAYAYKKDALESAVENEDWHSVVFLHERAYRLRALIDSVIGRTEYEHGGGDIIPLCLVDRVFWSLAADVWVDSENIEQLIEDWRALFAGAGEPGCDLWLGTDDERRAFDVLPDPIPAYRGGVVGDWSWTTNRDTAQFFARRSGYPVREALIPKADCFGYLTRRSEYELLVRLTDERRSLVYPNESEEI